MQDIKSRIRASRKQREFDDGAIDIDRAPLGDLAAEDFYADGCDGSSVFLIPSESTGDDDDVKGEQEEGPMAFHFTAEVKGKGKEIDIDIDALMSKDGFEGAPKAAVLQPIEKAEEGFDLWESGSSKDDE